MDVHADPIVVVRILEHSAPQPAQKFTPAKFLDWAKTQLAQGESVHNCYEAGLLRQGQKANSYHLFEAEISEKADTKTDTK